MSWDVQRLLSLDHELILQGAHAVLASWETRGFVRFASNFAASWVDGDKPLIVGAGLGALGKCAPNHGNALEGGWPFDNMLARTDHSPFEVAGILLTLIVPHYLSKLDPADANGTDLRKLARDEKISANRIAKLQDPLIINHRGRHYVRFGPDLPFDLDDVKRYLAARSNADE